MTNDETKPADEQDEALSQEDLKKVAGGLDGPSGGVLGEAGAALGEAF